jgi:hypothetical protein
MAQNRYNRRRRRRLSSTLIPASTSASTHNWHRWYYRHGMPDRSIEAIRYLHLRNSSSKVSKNIRWLNGYRWYHRHRMPGRSIKAIRYLYLWNAISKVGEEIWLLNKWWRWRWRSTGMAPAATMIWISHLQLTQMISMSCTVPLAFRSGRRDFTRRNRTPKKIYYLNTIQIVVQNITHIISQLVGS